MEDPGARIVGVEANCSIAAVDSNGVTLNRVEEIRDIAIRGLNDVESMPVEMEGVSTGSRNVNLDRSIVR